MNQISFPMYAISLPKNQLSLTGLEIVITASSILSHEVIDLSYNAKLMSLGNGHIFKLLNDNPSVKKLILKGCIAQMGNEEKLFENFTSSMCLREL